jgi:hypothetical protein
MHTGFLIDAVRTELKTALAALREKATAGELQLESVVASADVDDVLSRALVHFTVYHSDPAVERRGNRVFVLNRALLYYYRNRLEGVGLPAAAAQGSDQAPPESAVNA